MPCCEGGAVKGKAWGPEVKPLTREVMGAPFLGFSFLICNMGIYYPTKCYWREEITSCLQKHGFWRSCNHRRTGVDIRKVGAKVRDGNLQCEASVHEICIIYVYKGKHLLMYIPSGKKKKYEPSFRGKKEKRLGQLIF